MISENIDYDRAREKMVKYQLKKRGIDSSRVLTAMETIPRHLFVPYHQQESAYGDFPLPIGEGQTISQPYIVALMTQLLQPESEDRVLEIGTGSGYQTAILAELSSEIFTIERKKALQTKAQETLSELGYHNIKYKVGDGTKGWPKYSPFDKIIGTGAVPNIPPSLIDQLADPGKLIIPAGSKHSQQLRIYEKLEGNEEIRKDISCSFIPLIGKEGFR